MWATLLHKGTEERLVIEFWVVCLFGPGSFNYYQVKFHLWTLDSKFTFFILADPSPSACSPHPGLASSAQLLPLVPSSRCCHSV